MKGQAPSAEFLLKMLVELLADQKGLNISYTIKKGDESHEKDERQNIDCPCKA